MQRRKDDSFKIKRFGQIFSGKMIGNLLVSLLPDKLCIESVIDPMVGRGDLLQAVYIKYSEAKSVTGIDIDPDVIEICRKNIPGAEIINEDAFKSEKINVSQGWDLVITNPPYIRYQTLKSNPEIGLPNGEELRENLTYHIQKSSILDENEKKLYLSVVKKYSGLSDMAVPSWILCASIVKKGGYMAMVVPETWLNREYALPIYYLLLRCFDIIVIAKDTESAWFEKAEVRTCLVVSRRKNNEPLTKNYEKTIFFDMESSIINSKSLVGKMVYGDSSGYNAIKKIIESKKEIRGNGYASRIVPSLELFPRLISELSEHEWICEEDRMEMKSIDCLPNEIRILVEHFHNIEYENIESSGWSIGQGLRTGANDFFYADILSEENEMTLIQTESWYGKDIYIDSHNLRKALKKRCEANGNVVGYDDLKKCILYIQNQVKYEDYQRTAEKCTEKYTIIDRALSDYITEGEKYVSPSHKKPFRELSAVKTNERKSKEGFERFWYMLPALKARHTPDLCMPRVCGDGSEVIFINQKTDKEIVVDANFITLWNPDLSSRIRTLALLNSIWAKVFLEVTGTVMGGGALKIEACHVRKMVFPKLGDEREVILEDIGKRILKEKNISKKIQDKIDEIVLSPFGDDESIIIKHQLERLYTKKLKERTGRKN